MVVAAAAPFLGDSSRAPSRFNRYLQKTEHRRRTPNSGLMSPPYSFKASGMALLLALFSGFSSAALARPASMTKTVTQEFVGADLVQVVKTLGRQMECNVFIGPHVDGVVTVSLRSVPPEAALGAILEMQNPKLGYKIAEPYILIVGMRDQLDAIDNEIIRCRISRPRQGDRIRREFLLSHNDAKEAMKVFLYNHHQDAEIIPHPTMNGFYAVGNPKVVAKIACEVREMEANPVEEPN